MGFFSIRIKMPVHCWGKCLNCGDDWKNVLPVVFVYTNKILYEIMLKKSP
jgi:hypothetical protein